MKVIQGKLIDVMGQPNIRFAIPVFQRVYSWDARQCEELWEDIMHAGRTAESDAEDAEHFVGVLLVSPDPDQHDNVRTLNLIDGQQRLTTMSLLLIALRSHLEQLGLQENAAGLPAADEITQRYLTVQGSSGATCKLVLSSSDRETLDALACGGEQPEQTAQRLVDNCLLFADKMKSATFDIECLWRGICALQVACAQLGTEDSPQLVFESLNAKGMPLSTADRVRNLVVVSDEESGADGKLLQTWMDLEDAVAEAECDCTLSDVLHAWLARNFRSVRIFDPSDVYGVFKTSLRSMHNESLERALQNFSDYCRRYLDNPSLRAQDTARANSWIAGKPEKSVSEFKMFGD